MILKRAETFYKRDACDLALLPSDHKIKIDHECHHQGQYACEI